MTTPTLATITGILTAVAMTTTPFLIGATVVFAFWTLDEIVNGRHR